ATGFLTSEDINNTLDYYLDLANQTRTQIVNIINGLNDVSANQIDLMINNSRTIANQTRQQIIEVGNFLWTTATGFSIHNVNDIWANEDRNLTTLTVGDDIIATQENITQLNLTISEIVNESSIALEVLKYTDLANKTITYNYAWDLMNVTTTYDDLGYEILETYVYNDTSNKWYLNSTQQRRIN
ncbi:hypothetical protein LCGC14_1164970, partial [marine sediment metagenome]